MRSLRPVFASALPLLICVAVSAIFPAGFAAGRTQQTPQKTVPPERAATPRVQANLDQVMRGILFTNANVVFFAQNNDPASVRPTSQPSSATDPLTGVYGGWVAVENSALALSESANLLTIPRICSNGKPAPVTDPDWVKFAEGLRASGLVAYQAAQTKNTDKMLDASDQVGIACLNCHDRYRKGVAERCT
jgi:hypothetical protein